MGVTEAMAPSVTQRLEDWLEINSGICDPSEDLFRAALGEIRQAQQDHLHTLQTMGAVIVAAGALDREIRVPIKHLERPPAVIVHRNEDPKAREIVFRFELGK